MNFLELISPMTPKEFLEKAGNNESFCIKGEKNKFDNLITLQEIENTLNNYNLSNKLQKVIILVISDSVCHV